MLEELFGFAGLAEGVLHADADDGSGEFLGEEFADGAAEASGDLGFFDGDDGAAVFGCGEDGF